MNARRLGTRPRPLTSAHPRSRRRRLSTLLCAALLSAVFIAACAHPKEVVQVDVRAEEERVIQAAIQSVLEREGYALNQYDAKDRFFTTEWQAEEDTLHRVTVRLTHTTLGFALATKVVYAAPDAGQENPIMRFSEAGREWVVTGDEALKAKAKEREAFLGREIQTVWQDSRRVLLSQEPR